MLIINTDGASRGNPGPASYGYSIKTDRGEVVHEKGGTIGINTNNVAEYTAVLEAFKYLFNSDLEKPLRIELVADSQLIVRQLAGIYKIKNERLKVIFNEIKSLEIELGDITYRSVPREQNKVADALANKALDEPRSWP